MTSTFGRKLTIIGRGKAGWHGAGVSNHGTFSVTGGDLADRLWGPAREVRPGLLSEAADGTLIYDMDGCKTGDVIDFAFKGPMCLPGTPDTDRDPSTFRPMDSVSERDIVRFAATFEGARTGVVMNHQIVWADQTQQ